VQWVESGGANVKLTIDVTWEDIDRGQRGICARCPIALAAERAGIQQPLVFSLGIWHHSGSGFWSSIPDEAIRFLEDFDTGSPVAPFTFEVNEAPSLLLPPRIANGG
jgi:hypothetical protein